MIINVKTASKDHYIAKELRHLLEDGHTPSGQLVRDTIEVSCIATTSSRTIYRVAPKRAKLDIVIATLSELKNRSPELLTALLDTVRRGSPHLEVYVQQHGRDLNPIISEDEKLLLIPSLIEWLSTGRVRGSRS